MCFSVSFIENVTISPPKAFPLIFPYGSLDFTNPSKLNSSLFLEHFKNNLTKQSAVYNAYICIIKEVGGTRKDQGCPL